MPKRLEYPRLTRRDCERLLDVHQQLNRARETLDRSAWTGGRAVSALIMSALVLVSELYNRAEQTFLRGADPQPEPSLEDLAAEVQGPELEAPGGQVSPQDKPEG
jgi:hypothetical protein